MKNLIQNFLKFLVKFFNNASIYLDRIQHHFSKDYLNLRVLSIEFNKSGRFYSFYLQNKYLYDRNDVLQAIFNTLKNNQDFLSFGKKKVIFVSALIDGIEFSFHHNVLVTNDTLFIDYYNQVKDRLNQYYEEGYPVDVIPTFKVRIWNMDMLENKNIKINQNTEKRTVYSKPSQILKKISNIRKYHNNLSNFITPLPLEKKDSILDKINKKKLISTMDIETINIDGKQIPIAISLSYFYTESKLFLIDYDLIETDFNKGCKLLWVDVLNFIFNNNEYFNNIFVHNLGSFDGYFIYKELSNLFKPSELTTIIDDKNKFIQITLNKGDFKIVWKDSYRIFPLSLDNLCKNFRVTGKISKYDIKFNDLNLFKDDKLLNEFKIYALQDSICLLKALNSAQEIYISDYNTDITSILSTSTLSLKIFRKIFLYFNIPIIRGWIDNFIRKAYLGGATDYYKAYGENLKYYDINSLYPKAMLKPMPFEIIKNHKDLSKFKLEDFFGFCLAEIECPKDIKIPLLPHKFEDKTIFPTGKWLGVYFSEELKAVKPHGYNINLIRGFEFSKVDLFDKYVNHFFEKKKSATNSSDRFIAKMHLNQLYGIFGRKQELIETINVYNNDLDKYLSTRIIKSIIEINSEISTLLIINNINPEIISEMNSNLKINLKNTFTQNVKSNVAIAAAVTSYARIHMIKFKLKDNIYYTDTDSIDIDRELDPKYIGDELGQLKLEHIFDDAVFLSPKMYGGKNKDYQYVRIKGLKNSIPFIY